MTKYANLGKYLEQQDNSLIRMTFREVEAVIGCSLPRSSRYPAWWSNNPSNNVMTKVWLEAGFKTEQVDIEGRKLVFRRVKPRQPPTPVSVVPGGFSESGGNALVEHFGVKTAKASSTPAPVDTSAASLLFHPAFGSMKGLIQIAPGVDLTEPADPEWGKVYDK
jgi:hypothetical protein